MLHISSRENPLYKRLSRLAQGKRELGSTPVRPSREPQPQPVLLEGVHLCQDWLRHRGQPAYAVFDADRLQTSSELRELADQVDAKAAVSMDSALVHALSRIAAGQGVFFLAHVVPPAMPERITEACIWLDRVQDPGNLGTLLRTAAAAGIRHAYLSLGCAGAWSPRVLRSAQGAHFVLSIYEQLDLVQTCERMDIPLCATALDGVAVSLYDKAPPFPCAWVFGNEGQGVHPDLLKLARHKVWIPQDASVESLNVAVAAGICLFEQRRQMLVP